MCSCFYFRNYLRFKSVRQSGSVWVIMIFFGLLSIIIIILCSVTAVHSTGEKPFHYFILVQETEKFEYDIEVGKEKIHCTFTMVFQGSTMNLKRSKAVCSKAKKTTTVNDLDIISESSGNIFSITMMLKRGSTKGKLRKVVLKLQTTTTTTKQPSKIPRTLLR